MLNSYQLKQIYDAWCSDNEAYVERWIDFVELIAKEFDTTGDEVMRVLQTCRWFRKGE